LQRLENNPLCVYKYLEELHKTIIYESDLAGHVLEGHMGRCMDHGAIFWGISQWSESVMEQLAAGNSPCRQSTKRARFLVRKFDQNTSAMRPRLKTYWSGRLSNKHLEIRRERDIAKSPPRNPWHHSVKHDALNIFEQSQSLHTWSIAPNTCKTP
jgi:hypothetical protein